MPDAFELARSFGGVAAGYHRYRPAPPAAAVDWAVPAGCRVAVDIGAGTGALSRQLVERAPTVAAVEPDLRMGAVLAVTSPGALLVAATAEALPLADASVDLVVGSSMWHWVDEERAATEIARVLRPGGTFALLWNGADRSVDWVGGLFGGPDTIAFRPDRCDEPRRRRWDVHLPDGAPFTTPEVHLVDWSYTMPTADLPGLAGTYSAVITLPPAERAAFDAHGAELLATHPALAGRDVVEVPMRCVCWRTCRR